MSNLSTVEIVNVYCNMTGASLNESQKQALSRLLQSVFESGAEALESSTQDEKLDKLRAEANTYANKNDPFPESL